jgi:hypothetical protein
VPTRLDLGDCFWEEQERLEETEHWYAVAVRLDPNEPWALPSLLAVRYLRTGNRQSRNQLEEYVEANPQNERAQVVLGRVTPFFSSILYPADATVKIVSELADKVDPANDGAITGRLQVATTGLEAPSCRRSIDRQLQRWGGQVQIEREIRGVQIPDPRQPRLPVRYRLWEYDEFTPRPIVAPPPPTVSEPISAIAASRYDLGKWLGYAANAAARLGPESVPGLLGIMAHPPDSPNNLRMWFWTLRVQLAAALVLSKLGRDWEGSVRRQVLFDLATRPMDWTTVAAVVALTAIGLQNPALAPEIARLFSEVRRDLPRPGQEWYESVLLNLHLRLPGLSPAEKQEERTAREECESRAARRISDAQLAAQLFLKKPLPEGCESNELTRNLIELYANKKMPDHPSFPMVLDSCLHLAELSLPGIAPAAKSYLEEQVAVLRMIQAEIAKSSQGTQPADSEQRPR